MLGYQINNRFGVQVSPQYFGAGQKFVGVLISSPRAVKYDIRLHYLQLPIQLNIHLHSPDSKLTSTILLGGYIGSLLSYTDTRYNSQYTPNINNKLSSDVSTYSNLSGTVQATYFANNQDSVVTLQGTFTKPLFNKMDVGAMLGYQMGYQISKQISVNLNAHIKYGFSQIDNLDTIGAYLNSTPNIIKNYSKKQELYCRNGRGGNAVDGLRDPKSNNIFVGLQLSFIYTFSAKNNY